MAQPILSVSDLEVSFRSADHFAPVVRNLSFEIPSGSTLAMVGGRLHANAVGRDAVVRIDPDGSFQPVWWHWSPDCSRW